MRGRAKKGLVFVTACNELTSLTLVFLPSRPAKVVLTSIDLPTYSRASGSQPCLPPTPPPVGLLIGSQ